MSTSSKRKTEKESTERPKKACLNKLRGDFTPTRSLVEKLKIPTFLADLEAKYWKNEEKLVKELFKHSPTLISTSSEVSSLLITSMNSIIKEANIKVVLK